LPLAQQGAHVAVVYAKSAADAEAAARGIEARLCRRRLPAT
jgi:hypothetical protein